ncbi:acetylserotonin O-methyltransferase-like [Glandiceps talaboti]
MNNLNGTNLKNGVAGIFDLISGFQKSKVLFTACEFGIFDLMSKKSKQQMTAEQVALDISTDTDATERLLDACVSLGLLNKTVRDDELATYSNTKLSAEYLSADKAMSLKGLALFANRTTWPLMTNLEHAVREGKEQRQRSFGANGDKLYEKVYSEEQRTINFIGGMHGFGLMSAKSVARAFDLSEFKRVCDFGGGSGALAHEMSLVYPDMSITVLDLPPVVKVSKYFKPNDGVERSVDFMAGDFFKNDLPEADLYVYSLILHNWPEEKIHILLEKTYKALKPGGAILIAEHLYNDEKSGPSHAALRCMMMLAGTEGKERSGKEYRQLLELHGFDDVRVKYTGHFQDLVLARRA